MIRRHSSAPRPVFALALVAAAALACGKPAAPDGGSEDFAQAGVQGSGQPLVTGKSLELVSWLVQFNRLNSPEKLEAMLNKTPGKFVPVDADNDGSQDYIAVSEDPEPARDKHALVLHARSSADDDSEGVLVATLFFTEDWALTGYTRSVSAAPTPSPTTKAAAAASAAAFSASEQSAPAPAPAIAEAPAVEEEPDDPALAAGELSEQALAGRGEDPLPPAGSSRDPQPQLTRRDAAMRGRTSRSGEAPGVV